MPRRTSKAKTQQRGGGSRGKGKGYWSSGGHQPYGGASSYDQEVWNEILEAREKRREREDTDRISRIVRKEMDRPASSDQSDHEASDADSGDESTPLSGSRKRRADAAKVKKKKKAEDG